jgi:succinoglycan biosynthesis protein ExoV
MDIYAWSSGVPNLGDDLNNWLWKRVLPSTFLREKGTLIGIGSVISPEHLSSIENPNPIHILGAGCRNQKYPLSEVSNDLKIHAVRGPLSSVALGQNDQLPLIDGAYALKLTKIYGELIKQPKRYKFTLIPYFRSRKLINYTILKESKDINILHSSDYKSIENALLTIAQSEYIISESMHGAVIADVLRVPWSRLNYFLQNPRDKETAEFKWKDWAYSMEMDDIPCLSIPLRNPHSINPRRNWFLYPFRSLDYFRNFKVELAYRLSDEKLMNQKITQLKSIILKLAS